MKTKDWLYQKLQTLEREATDRGIVVGHLRDALAQCRNLTHEPGGEDHATLAKIADSVHSVAVEAIEFADEPTPGAT